MLSFMSMTKVERMVAEFAALSEEERQQVADRILELVPNESEIAAAWNAEAERRFAEHDAGKTKSVPWLEARERIFARP